MQIKLFAGVALAALMIPGAAYAQSTGSIEFDQGDIVVTGARNTNGVQGVVVPDTSKARQVLTQKFIENQRAGQTIDDTINQMPGVSFQNNDPYGSSGGTLTIHGFDASRISQTFDGIPLNDTGNYALYSNQQLDSELIAQVNVSLGSTDIDSPTASATGSTVNYTTRNPTEDFHARVDGSVGEYGYFRTFGVIDTGDLTSFGTRMWVAASHAENYNPYNHQAKISKQQYNAKLYQPIGSNGDFISIAGHYNQNQNSNFSSVPLRTDLRADGPQFHRDAKSRAAALLLSRREGGSPMVNLSSFIRFHASRTPDRLAVLFKDQRITYAALARRIETTAGFLAAQDIKPGDVVALFMKNSAAFLELAFAVSHLGAVLLPINFVQIESKAGEIYVHAIRAGQFVDVPATKNPDQVTLLEEEKVMAYYGGGTLYALPQRAEPIL